MEIVVHMIVLWVLGKSDRQLRHTTGGVLLYSAWDCAYSVWRTEQGLAESGSVCKTTLRINPFTYTYKRMIFDRRDFDAVVCAVIACGRI